MKNSFFLLFLYKITKKKPKMSENPSKIPRCDVNEEWPTWRQLAKHSINGFINWIRIWNSFKIYFGSKTHLKFSSCRKIHPKWVLVENSSNISFNSKILKKLCLWRKFIQKFILCRKLIQKCAHVKNSSQIEFVFS